VTNQPRVRALRFGIALLAVAAILAIGVGCSNRPDAAPVKLKSLETEYQAVMLTNGQVFFGKLEGLGTPYPVLNDVYYVRTVGDPKDPGKATSALIKRGQEWHAPDSMVLNAAHILLVEPVTKSSKVAQLIAEKKQKESPEKKS